MRVSHKKKSFSQFFAAFLKSRLSFKHFWKKMTLTDFVFPKITDCENVVRWMSKKSCSRGPFDKQHGKRAEALSKYASQHLYHIHWWLPNQSSVKMFLLLTCQILGLLVNTLAADEKYLVLHTDNITIPI